MYALGWALIGIVVHRAATEPFGAPERGAWRRGEAEPRGEEFDVAYLDDVVEQHELHDHHPHPGEDLFDDEGAEEGEGSHAAAARFSCMLGVMVVVASMVIKEAQARKSNLHNTHPLTFQMIEAIIEECVACGAICMCFILLRENSICDVPGTIAKLPVFQLDTETVTLAVEHIDALVFWTFFYYFMMITVCVLFVNFRRKSWPDEERKSLHQRGSPENSPFQRLRWAFFHPVVPQAGIRISRESTAFDVKNLNFASYLGLATAKCMAGVICLPKIVILLPVVIFLFIFFARSLFVHSEEGHGDTNLYVAVSCAWMLFLSAGLLWLDIRRIYWKIVPTSVKACPPFLQEAVAGIEARRKEDEQERLAKMRTSLLPMEKGMSLTMGSRAGSRTMSSPRDPPYRVSTSLSSGPFTNLAQDEGGRALTPRTPRSAAGSPQEAEATPTGHTKRPALALLDLQTHLFWLGWTGYGPWLLKIWIQGCLFGICVLVSISKWTFSWHYLFQKPLLCCLLYLPVPGVFLCIITLLEEYIVITNVELMTDVDLIDEVISESKVKHFVPFTGTHTGKRLVQQMKYEAVMEKYRVMGEAEFKRLVQSSEEEIQQMPRMEQALMEVIFNQHDRDASGTIDMSELEACLMEEGFSKHTAGVVARDWMKIYDTDQSGFLNFAEFQMLNKILMQDIRSAEVQPSDCLRMCRRLDKNRNGKLSTEELSDALNLWLDTRVDQEDVMAIFLNDGEEETPANTNSNSNDMTDEVEVRRIAEWAFRIYQMTASLEKSEDEMRKV
mmetsp:Transcript_75429/g.174879  ORF Transcript_75429/g.174879 Transcript_75429/m.174879 type:complete len:783 (-) Transcript_75429:238-2586(-)